MIEFKLPDVGEGMHEGEIMSWFVGEGEVVKADQPIVEVQTDKVSAELTAPKSGQIKKIHFSVGDIVEVGKILFTMEEEGCISAKQREAEPVQLGVPSKRVALATPYVRQKARELKIDLENIQGSGPAGRVTESDLARFSEKNDDEVKRKTEQANPMPKPIKEDSATEERIPLTGIRRKIAEHMTKSVSIIPHVTHVDEMEMDSLKELKDRLSPYATQKDIKLTFLPFFIKAIVTCLKEFPMFNASIDDAKKEIVLKKQYHIGVATHTPNGLLVPVIKHADRKSILQLADEVKSLASRARDGELSVHELSGSTFTISNVGPVGGQQATPIINHPEVALLALHKMEPRMVVREWEGVIRLMMNMSLAFDHRLIDGVTAVQFTNRLKELLENPNYLFMEMR